MNPPEPNDPLDALLREQNSYIEDNGFTARVVGALPARKHRAWLRPTLLLSATAIGYLLAIFWLPWETMLPTLLSFNSQALLMAVLLISIAGSLLWGVIAAVGFEE